MRERERQKRVGNKVCFPEREGGREGEREKIWEKRRFASQRERERERARRQRKEKEHACAARARER